MAPTETVEEKVDRLELPFNSYGIDPYGISRPHLVWTMKAAEFLYHRYFRMKSFGLHHIPPRGRAMLVGNHSGGVAVDAAMVISACFLEMNPPRWAQGMAEKFINRFPVASWWSCRTGQITGLPDNAARLLHDERLLLVFPEGARGTAKLYKDRYSLVDFGQGFLRLALRTKTPIIPFGFLGGGSAIPTIANLYSVGKHLGVPYWPLTPYLLPLPLPVRLEVHFGEPMFFEGTGHEEDAVISSYVDQVKARIAHLIEVGRKRRKHARDEESAL